MTAALSRFTFQGDDLEIATNDGRVMVGVRAICDGIGIDFASQWEKLKADPSATVGLIPMVAADGKTREIACVDLRSLPLWLATIHPSKVKPSIREKVIAYRREAADVLADHFLGPRMAPPPPPPARGKPLTARQSAILGYMKAHARTFGAPPTYREIAAHFGFSSTNAVNDHLLCLEKKGAIQLRHEGRSRGIILPPEPPAPPAVVVTQPEPNERIDRLERMVEQLVGAVSMLASRAPRRRLPAPSMSLPFVPAA